MDILSECGLTTSLTVSVFYFVNHQQSNIHLASTTHCSCFWWFVILCCKNGKKVPLSTK